MPLYECVFIARQDISATQVEGLVEQFAGIVKDNGGQVTKQETWGLRTLAYRIKKNRKGHYVLLNIDAPSGAVQEMERNMRLHEDVIRYLTVRAAKLEEGPSIVLQSRHGRDERGGGGGRPGGRDHRPPPSAPPPSAPPPSAADPGDEPRSKPEETSKKAEASA